MDILPEKNSYIYKFVPFSINTLKLLIKGEIWLGFPENFNDPFEGEFLIERMESIPTKKALYEFYGYYRYLSENEFERKYQEIKKDDSIFYWDLGNYIKIRRDIESGVSCFTKRRDSILMWSHYADSHKGICLVFDKNELIQSINKVNPNIQLYEVHYDPTLPTAKISQKGDDIHFDTDREVYLNKYIDWEKEKELRLFGKFINKDDEFNRSIPFNKNCLKSIIFGERIDEDNRNTLKTLIDNDNKYNIEWGVAEKDFKEMKMQIYKLKQ